MAGARGGAARKGANSPRTLLLVLLLAALAASAGSWSLWPRRRAVLPPDAQTQAMLEWAVAKGASLPGVVVGWACPTCPRGVFASRDLQPGELVMRVPVELALELTVSNKMGDVSPYDQAAKLLVRIHSDPAFNATWGTYWASLPGPDDVLVAELFTKEQIGMLQHPALVRVATSRHADASAVFTNATHNSPSLPGVSLEAFNHVAALLLTRPFMPLHAGNIHINSSYLLPLVDLINHSSHGNSKTKFHDGAFHTSTTKSVRQGEEITHAYGHRMMHRPDGALFFYGFVEPSDKPLLCTADLPAGYPPEARDDSLYDDPALGFITRAEHDRLAAALAAYPTSEADDQALLKSGVFTDWRDRAIVQARMLCKRAVRQAVAKLEVALSAGRVSAPAGGAANEPGKAEL